MGLDKHDGDTRDLSNPPLEILVAGGHNVHSVLSDSFNDAVVSVGALVVAFEPLKTRIFCDFEGDSVFDSELLQLSNHTVSYVGNA